MTFLDVILATPGTTIAFINLAFLNASKAELANIDLTSIKCIPNLVSGLSLP